MRAKSTHMGSPVMCAFCVSISLNLRSPMIRGGGVRLTQAELTPEPQTRDRVAVRRAVSVRRPRRRLARQGAGPAQRNTPQASLSQFRRCCQGRRGAATAAVARTERACAMTARRARRWAGFRKRQRRANHARQSAAGGNVRQRKAHERSESRARFFTPDVNPSF